MARVTRRHFINGTLATLTSAAGVLPDRWARAMDLPSPGANTTVFRPRTRFVWFGGAASIPGSYTQLEPDPNGQWVNRESGQHFSESDIPGPGGVGFTVSDVEDADESGAVLWTTGLLVHTDQNNVSSFIDSNGSVASTSNFGDFWVAPARLAQLRQTNTPTMRILLMPFVLGGRTYRAVCMQTRTSAGWTQNIYDLDTGLGIAETSTSQGAAVLTREPGNYLGTGAGSTQLTFTHFMGMRQTNLPGPGERYPDKFRALHTLSYAGRQTTSIPGGPVPSFPIEVRYELLSNPGPYLTATATISGTSPSTLHRVIPAGVIGSLWMNPDYLAQLRAGETLDQDPVTGVRATAAGQQNGLFYVVLQTGLARQTFGYDPRNGLLTFSDLRQQVGPATTAATVQLQGAR
jgi:hypothetical protein